MTTAQEGWTITAQWASGPNRVCSPIVASNGTEFYVSSIFLDKPFEVIGTFINGTKPDDCHKIWKTETDLPGPDIDLAVWAGNQFLSRTYTTWCDKNHYYTFNSIVHEFRGI